MAVPKKRRSKSKGRTRLAAWKAKSKKFAQKAYNLAKSIPNGQVILNSSALKEDEIEEDVTEETS